MSKTYNEEENKNQVGIKKNEPSDTLIRISSYSKKNYKKDYTLKARICMRIVSILLPGFLKIEIKK